MGRTSRDKGARGELEVRNVFRAAGIDADRTAQLQAGNIAGEADVRVGVPGLHVEVKRDERLSVDAMVRQAEAEAPEGATPVVAYRRNRQPWRAVVPLDHYARLLALRELADALAEAMDERGECCGCGAGQEALDAYLQGTRP